MTTVAYRNGILAADSRAYSGDRTPVGWKAKAHRASNGILYAVSSTCVGADALLRDWIEADCPRPANDDLKPESFTLLLVKPDGGVFFANGNLALSGPLTDDFFAIGSGEQYALGAMAMGASAEEAVAVACRLDPWSGGDITVLKLEP